MVGGESARSGESPRHGSMEVVDGNLHGPVTDDEGGHSTEFYYSTQAYVGIEQQMWVYNAL